MMNIVSCVRKSLLTMLMKNQRMNAREKRLLFDLICAKQMEMIAKDVDNFESDVYRELENLKAKIREMK